MLNINKYIYKVLKSTSSIRLTIKQHLLLYLFAFPRSPLSNVFTGSSVIYLHISNCCPLFSKGLFIDLFYL